MKPVKGYWVVLGLFAAMLALWGMRFYLASSPKFPGPRYFQLTHDAGRTFDPVLSSDGRLIAFASDKAGAGTLDIWAKQVGGGESIQITHGPGDKREPALSADGLTIAYTAADGIYTSDLRGGAPVRLVPGGRTPAYSPDGQSLAYTDVAGTVFVMPAAGGAPRKVGYGGAPSWSADSQALLLCGDPWQIVPLNGRPAQVIGGYRGAVRWYRDFAYYSANGEIQRVRLPADGQIDGKPETLTSQVGPPASNPAVAGARLVYLRGGSLWLTNLSAGK